jgi:acylphosphatase
MIRGVVHEAIKSNYSKLNLIWTEGLIESLTNLRTAFGNDMDKIVVLAVIGQSAQRLTPIGNTFEDSLKPSDIELPRAAVTNVQSITDSTGIPRESVRRKVNELVESGWVEKLEDGSIRIIGSAAASDLRRVTEKQFVVIDKTMSAMITELESMRILKVLPVASSEPHAPTEPTSKDSTD